MMDDFGLPQFSDSCRLLSFFLLLIVSGLWIFEEVVISDLGFLNVSEALKPSF